MEGGMKLWKFRMMGVVRFSGVRGDSKVYTYKFLRSGGREVIVKLHHRHQSVEGIVLGFIK